MCMLKNKEELSAYFNVFFNLAPSNEKRWVPKLWGRRLFIADFSSETV